MGKFASVVCLFVLTATFFGITAAGAQTLNVGLTIVPANGAARATPARSPNTKLNGNVRIIEYASPGYATVSKPRKQASPLALR
ncbi:hypothetical protein CU102_00545 [Phyllobacterium brassicacearum]|uniref:Uncharacterized protein n=1 Tax=Phyllobacterium brassicacearum TaxID=314235 RepID=A0A2P7BVT4_9HYPH|nr:hypothetical protein CU102_00545 [Phyllobacterium brassicacearum]TDQ35958.1 hypothetical protein DEV91_101444 [Phyllobacterium brassicacearum]